MRRGQRRGRSWVCRRCITTRHINDARTVAIGIVGIVIITIVPIIVNVRSDQYSISSVIFDEVKRLSCPRIDAYLTVKNCPRPKRSVVSSQTTVLDERQRCGWLLIVMASTPLSRGLASGTCQCAPLRYFAICVSLR